MKTISADQFAPYYYNSARRNKCLAWSTFDKLLGKSHWNGISAKRDINPAGKWQP